MVYNVLYIHVYCVSLWPCKRDMLLAREYWPNHPRRIFFYEACKQKLSTKKKKNTVYEDKILQPVLHSNSSKETILFDSKTTLFQEVYNNKFEVLAGIMTARMNSSLISTTATLKSSWVLPRQQRWSPRWYPWQQCWSPYGYHYSNAKALVDINDSNVEVPAGIITATMKSPLISMTAMLKSSQVSKQQWWSPCWYQRQ